MDVFLLDWGGWGLGEVERQRFGNQGVLMPAECPSSRRPPPVPGPQVKKIERGEAEPPPLAFRGDSDEEEEEWEEDAAGGDEWDEGARPPAPTLLSRCSALAGVAGLPWGRCQAMARMQEGACSHASRPLMP